MQQDVPLQPLPLSATQEFIVTRTWPSLFIDDLEPEKGADKGKVDGVTLLAVDGVTVATLGPADRDMLIDEDEAEFAMQISGQASLQDAKNYLDMVEDMLTEKYVKLFS